MKLSRRDIEREVTYVRQYFGTDEFVPTATSAAIERRCVDLIQDFEAMMNAVQPLRPGDTGIVTLTRRKTAALVADRVWAADTSEDLAINFGWESPMEVRLRALMQLQHLFERSSSAPSGPPSSPGEMGTFIGDVEHDLAVDLSVATGLSVSPLYSLESRRESQYQSGDQAAVVCLVNNLNIVDEEQLSWEQVAGFRQDEEARKAYRRFVHWLDGEMIDKPIQYVTDEISKRLELYEWSLQKHGIKTLVGSLNHTLNPKSLISTSSAGIAVNVIVGKPLWSLLAAGGLLLGQVALSVATALVERRDIKMAHREISYVQQLKRDIG